VGRCEESGGEEDALMGHDIITFEDKHVILKDWLIWTLRHFFVAETQAAIVHGSSTDTAALESLRCFFERWEWIGPGVVTGIALSDFVQGRERNRGIILEVFRRTIIRLRQFGESIPLAYLEEHLPGTFGIKQPTQKYIEAVEKLCSILEQPS